MRSVDLSEIHYQRFVTRINFWFVDRVVGFLEITLEIVRRRAFLPWPIAPWEDVASLTTRISARFTRARFVLDPYTYIRCVSMMVVSMFVSFFNDTYVAMFFVVFRIILVEGQVWSTRIAFNGFISICPMVTARRILRFTVVLHAIATWVCSSICSKVVTRHVERLYVRIPIRLINVTFFCRVSEAISQAVHYVFFLVAISIVRLSPVGIPSVVHVNAPYFVWPNAMDDPIEMTERVSMVIKT